jgi:[protein-PII] uridylyltransferase
MDVATRIERPERLAALYLLSQADAEATGPNASTPWRQTLIRELVAKVQHVLERGAAGSDIAGQLASAADAVRSALGSEDAERVERFLLGLPNAYLLGVSTEQAALDFPLLGAPIGATEVRTTARAGARAGTFVLTVVAGDRPGLLSRVAGALSLSQFSIQSAQVFTTEEAFAVDHFEVAPAFGAEVGEEAWRDFRTTLRKALEGRISLDYRVKEKRGHYPAPRRGIPIEVRVENGASDFYSIIEVGAADRIGLLYDITRTLFDLSLDVHIAKVSTYGDRVIDAFYVRDVLGEKIIDDEHSEEVVRAITARLSES